MKVIELTEKEYYEIKFNSVSTYVNDFGKEENALVKAVIYNFLMLCNNRGYTVIDGKIYKQDAKKE